MIKRTYHLSDRKLRECFSYFVIQTYSNRYIQQNYWNVAKNSNSVLPKTCFFSEEHRSAGDLRKDHNIIRSKRRYGRRYLSIIYTKHCGEFNHGQIVFRTRETRYNIIFFSICFLRRIRFRTNKITVFAKVIATIIYERG